MNNRVSLNYAWTTAYEHRKFIYVSRCIYVSRIISYMCEQDEFVHNILYFHETVRSRMHMRSPSCHNVDSYSVTFTDMKLFSDIKVTTVIYQCAN